MSDSAAIMRAVDAAALLPPDGGNDFTPWVRPSGAGSKCMREVWLSYRWASVQLTKSPSSIYAIDDGHRSEIVMAERLRKVYGVNLRTVDSNTGRQLSAKIGMICGSIDGIISGLPTMNKNDIFIWEHKAAGKKQATKIKSLANKHAESTLIFNWNQKYFVQAQIYMMLFDIKKHLMTISMDGMREVIYVITDYDSHFTESLTKKLTRLASSNSMPIAASDDPDSYICKFCNHKRICFEKMQPIKSCRSCHYANINAENEFTCKFHKVIRTYNEQKTPCAQYKINETMRIENADQI
jgi:CRISPR/Cas system-associated exonuclease Cas4 (RecB family)